MGTDDELLASKMGDTGKAVDTGHPLSQPGSDLPTPVELEYMLKQMRRRRRKSIARDELELISAKPGRPKDEIRYRMLWGDVLYRKNVDRLTGRISKETLMAEEEMKGHVDIMNKAYRLQIPYPQLLEVGELTPEGGVPIHELESVRVDPLPGQSIAGRPGEEW